MKEYLRLGNFGMEFEEARKVGEKYEFLNEHFTVLFTYKEGSETVKIMNGGNKSVGGVELNSKELLKLEQTLNRLGFNLEE